MLYLVIYNVRTGEIVSMTTLRDAEVRLNGGLKVTVPEGKVLKSIDISNPENPVPVFEDIQSVNIEKLEAQTYYTAVMTDTLIEED